MKVLVCGSRTFSDAQLVWDVLRGIEGSGREHFEVIEGGAQGADSHGRRWAEANHRTVHTYEADWKAHGKGAGPRRNLTMLKEGKPDLVIAFVDKPVAESRGTNHMVLAARAANVKAIVIESRPVTASVYPENKEPQK